MEISTIIGLIAGLLTTLSGLPQLYRTITTKETNDLSFWMVTLVFVGIMLWFVYGLMIKDLPVIAANAISMIIYGFILGFKIRYG